VEFSFDVPAELLLAGDISQLDTLEILGAALPSTALSSEDNVLEGMFYKLKKI
jgi:hypothetical protein